MQAGITVGTLIRRPTLVALVNDLVVRGRMPIGGELRPGQLAIRDGRIAEVGPHLSAARVIDAGDRVVLPGAIDCHVHFRDPGHPEKEDFGSGTRAAALGGVTTVMDMPNTSPPTLTRDALDDKLARARAKALVDFGLYCGLDERGDSLSILPEASAMKIYMGATTGNMLVRDGALIRRALEAATRAGRTVAVHAEHQDCLDRHAPLAGDDFPSHAASRPPACEAEAVRALVEAARGLPARVHVTHLSTAAGLAALRGTGFTSDATPHHLLMDASRLREGGQFKMNPPLRAAPDRDTLWSAFVAGDVPCVASDHAPHTRDEKQRPVMRECPAGVPGVQTMIPLLLAAASDGRVPLARVVDAMTVAARIFGLPGKGSLAPGADADLAIFDLAAARAIRVEDMASKAGWTPFEGMPAVFPTDVLVRGRAVVQDGRVVGEPGQARFVRPA